MNIRAKQLTVGERIIFVVVILGIFFRCWAINHQVFWHDEVYTKLHLAGYFSHTWKSALFTGEILTVRDLQSYLNFPSETTLWDTLTVLAKEDPHHPPLYYILARFWLQIWGDSIFILRSFSVIAGLFVLFSIYHLAQELFQSKTINLIAVTLVAISPFHVLYAQEAREYALWTVIIIYNNLALLRALRLEKNSNFNWGLYTLSLGLSLYTSAFTGLLILAQGFYVIIREKFKLTQKLIFYSISLGMAFLIFVPWVVVFIANYESFKRSTAWTKTIFISHSDLLKILGINISRLFVLINDDASIILAHFWIVAGIILVSYALYFLAVNQPWKVSGLVLSLSIIPILALLVPDLVWGGVRSLSSRYLIPSWIGIHLAVAYLLGTQLTKKIFWSIVTLLILGIGIISCGLNAYSDTAWTKGINYNLPKIARIINKSDHPLLVGNIQNYQPGTLLALSYLLSPSIKLQLLSNEANYQLPQDFESIYFLNPSETLKQRFQLESVFQDYHLTLGKLVFISNE